MKNILKLSVTVFLSAFLLSQSVWASGDKPAPLSVKGTTSISTVEAKKLFDEGVLFVDTRRTQYFAKGRIPKAVSISTRYALSEKALLAVMKKNDKAVFYCHGVNCPASSKGLERAIAWGFSNLYYYREGMNGWEKAGFTVEKKN